MLFRSSITTVGCATWVNTTGLFVGISIVFIHQPAILNSWNLFACNLRVNPILAWPPPSRHSCLECKRVTGSMQRNGAAPAFCFLLCVWGHVFGLAELIHNPGSASTRGPIDFVRYHVIPRLMSSFCVVPYEVIHQSRQQFRQRRVPSQIDVFAFDAPPKPLHAEPVIQGIRDSPGQHCARGPVDHGHQVHTPTREADVRNIHTPDRLGPVTTTPRSTYGCTVCCGYGRLVFGPGARPAKPSTPISRCTRLRLIGYPTPRRYCRIVRLP